MQYKKILIGLLSPLIFVGLLFAGTNFKNHVQSSPWIDETGGPDQYGYTWIDSDEPGGPPVEWIDITTSGTQITGLGDDNYVGPFSFGFDFIYYWYPVSELYVGSNGYLKFPPGALIASPFPISIPLTAEPNDFLSVYIADWTFDTGGQAYYWTNNTDSFVVSYINLPAWNTGGRHDFQVFLNGADSTIHFNYGAQTGTVYNNDLLIGIENVSGQVGLEHSHDAYVPHANYSVVFYAPASTNYQAHDMACTAVMNENSYGTFVVGGGDYTPMVWVKNVGNQFEASATVTCDIVNSSGSLVYSQNQTVTNLNPGDEVELTFTDWNVAAVGVYTINGYVTLIGDMNPTNDLLEGEMHAVTIPGELLYDDGTSAQSWSWLGGTGGMGQRFAFPIESGNITQLKFYIHTGGTTIPNFTAQVLDDDGSNGSPGTVLLETSITATTSLQWYTTDCTIPFASGDVIYVGWIMTGENCPSIGMDNASPFSRCGWEYTGVWAPFRSLETLDPMIRIMIASDQTPDVQITLTPENPPIQIPAGGGSFNFNIAAANNGASPIPVDVWTYATLPNGIPYGPIINAGPITVSAGLTIDRDRTQLVPATAPTGDYTYDAYMGDYPDDIWAEDHFDFEKLAFGDGDNAGGWFCWGESFPGEGMEGVVMTASSGYSLHSVSPNPFNSSTLVTFSLPQMSLIKIEVYNVLGQRIAVVQDGLLDSGMHSTAWNGVDNSGIQVASGLYFVSIQAEGISDGAQFNEIAKVLLTK